MSCMEIEQLMANMSELGNLLLPAETDLHTNGYSSSETDYDLNDVSTILKIFY